LTVVRGGSNGVAGTRVYMAPEALQRGQASPRSDVYSLAASLLHLVMGRPSSALPAGERGFDASGATSPKLGSLPSENCWSGDVPEEVQSVIAAGMERDPELRADPPRFLGMLREVRWERLAREVLGRQHEEPTTVRLQAAVAHAPADAPNSFTPLTPSELTRERLRTGDLVRIESVASADGYQ